MEHEKGHEMLEEHLSHRLTIDSHADAMLSNYVGILEAGCEVDPFQESYIKLNRYERRDTTMYVDSALPLCPVCGASFDYRRYQFCGRCGQRLEREVDGNT